MGTAAEWSPAPVSPSHLPLSRPPSLFARHTLSHFWASRSPHHHPHHRGSHHSLTSTPANGRSLLTEHSGIDLDHSFSNQSVCLWTVRSLPAFSFNAQKRRLLALLLTLKTYHRWRYKKSLSRKDKPRNFPRTRHSIDRISRRRRFKFRSPL